MDPGSWLSPLYTEQPLVKRPRPNWSVSPCKMVGPSPLESPAQRFLVPKLPPNENGHIANFISILYRIATSELYPLKALEFYLLKESQ